MGSMLSGLMGGGMMGGLMGGGTIGATPGDPGGELTAGGGSGSSGLLGLGIGNSALGGMLKSATKSSGSSSTASAASANQTQALRSIVKLVGSAFNTKQSQNRLQLQNQVVSEGGGIGGAGDSAGEGSI